jgi:hypothetical protein
MSDNGDEFEQWRSLNSTKEYEVSSFGRVRSHRIRKNEPVILKGSSCDTNHQYISVNIYLLDKKKYQHFFVHKLVAEHFVDNSDPEKYKYVDHIDGNRQNNHWKNLRWVTNQQNQLNKKMQTNNTSGLIGVRCRTKGSKTYWVVSWTNKDNKYCIRNFPTKDEAVEFRQKVIQEIYPSEYYDHSKKSNNDNNGGESPQYKYFIKQRKLFTSTIESFENEIWNVIPNTQNQYHISSYGRIKSFRKKCFAETGEIMKTNFDHANIAIRAEIYILKDTISSVAKKHQMSVHKLVAESFIENDDPSKKTCVDHIDGNRCNNKVENLRWVSYQQNNHNRKIPRTNKSGIKGVHTNKADGKFVATWRNEQGKHCHKSFYLIEEAIKYREEMVKKYYDPMFYKNS